MQIVYPCGCKAVVYASTTTNVFDINPIPYLTLCNDHLTEFKIKSRDMTRNIGVGI